MKTWEIKADGKIIRIQALKAEVAPLKNYIDQVVNIQQYHKELSGILGGKERATNYYSPFSKNGKILYEAQYEEEKNTFLEIISTKTLKKEDLPSIIKRSLEIYEKHIPIVDNRITPADIEIKNKVVNDLQEKQQAKRDAFIAKYCGKMILIQDHQMAVVLTMTFDDSDSMADYFYPHARLGVPMAIGVLAKGPQRESTARKFLTNYPELNKHTWTWKTETYSGGHGNYLISDWNKEKKKAHAYNGRSEVSTRWEISFDKYGKDFHTYKDYPDK